VRLGGVTMWPDVPFHHYENGWMWPEVALCLWLLAPRLAPRSHPRFQSQFADSTRPQLRGRWFFLAPFRGRLEEPYRNQPPSELGRLAPPTMRRSATDVAMLRPGSCSEPQPTRQEALSCLNGARYVFVYARWTASGELAALDPTEADPEGLVSTAR
jgi:hypothetical protein